MEEGRSVLNAISLMPSFHYAVVHNFQVSDPLGHPYLNQY